MSRPVKNTQIEGNKKDRLLVYYNPLPTLIRGFNTYQWTNSHILGQISGTSSNGINIQVRSQSGGNIIHDEMQTSHIRQS